MSVLVAYDSRFGGTKQIAEGISGALRPGGRVGMVLVTTDKLDLSNDLNLLIVGGPTERHGVTLPLRVMFEELPRGALLGLLSFDESAQAIFLGGELVSGSHASQRTAALIDEEATRILTEGMDTAAAILAANRTKLDKLAEALIRDETLEADQIAPILGPRVVESVGSILRSATGS